MMCSLLVVSGVVLLVDFTLACAIAIMFAVWAFFDRVAPENANSGEKYKSCQCSNNEVEYAVMIHGDVVVF